MARPYALLMSIEKMRNFTGRAVGRFVTILTVAGLGSEVSSVRFQRFSGRIGEADAPVEDQVVLFLEERLFFQVEVVVHERHDLFFLMFTVIVDAGVEQYHPDHLHQLFEILHKKANQAAFQDDSRVPELGVAFELPFQRGQALVVGDAEIFSGEVVVEPGGGVPVAAVGRHQHSVNRTGASEKLLVDVEEQRQPVGHAAIVE